MKIFFTTLFTTFSLLAFPSIEHISIDRQDFIMVKEAYDIYDSKGLVMKLYHEENNRDLHFVLSLTLDDLTGDCGKKALSKGSYKIQGNTLSLYHFWRREGKAYDAPYGAMIEVYEVDKYGQFSKISSKIYMESTRKNYDPDSGMKYLFKAPSNTKEKALLAEYIKEIEKKYQATFVYADEAKSLILEVQTALKKSMWN